MTTALALEYIPRRMTELGYCKNYHLRFRHLKLKPGEQRILQVPNSLFLLVEPPDDVRVESKMGLFDLSEENINELQYEHRGFLNITNLSALTSHLRMIQVIPKY